MDSKSLIHNDDKPKLLRALLLRHRHVNENAHGFPFGTRRKFSSYTSLQVISIISSAFTQYRCEIFHSFHQDILHTRSFHIIYRGSTLSTSLSHSISLLLLSLVWCSISALSSVTTMTIWNFWISHLFVTPWAYTAIGWRWSN